MSTRKIKPCILRKPTDKVNHNEVMRTVAKNTGFEKQDIEAVIDEYLSIVRAELLERRVVKMRNLGTLYPMVQPPRTVTNMGGIKGEEYNRITMEARWSIKFQTEEQLKHDVRDIMVTKKDLERIYYNEEK
tara:strand:+ start:1776 stop:2168 length:393 start_codon:yes stop_codon:yes gene_type:complete